MRDAVFFLPSGSLSEADRASYIKQYPDIRFVTINPMAPLEQLGENIGQGVRIAAGRGNTVVAIKKAFPHCHTAEIPITAYDVIRSIEHVGGIRGRTIAVVTNNADVIGLDMFGALLDARLLAYLFTPLERLPETIDKAIGEGAELILGGAITCSIARTRNVPHAVFQLGPESMRQTTAEVRRLRDSLYVETARQGVISRLMDNIAAGVVALDASSRISEINHVMGRFLRCGKEEWIGREIAELIPDLAGREPHTELEIPATVNGMPVLLNRTPIVHNNQLYGSVITIHEFKRVERMESALRREAHAKPHVARYRFGDIIGTSKAIRQTLEDGRNFARTDSKILITGESGTGKELFAQSMHNESARRGEPFVAVNCAALHSELLQSELFGYVEGAFTSANRQGKAGLFEVAHKGTIFLDEISEMALAQQAALLRVIEEGYIVRLGSSIPIPVDVRIIAATNRDLQSEVARGRFREDLYYRLNVLNLQVPPLRSRKSDIPALFRHCLNEFARFAAKPDIEEAVFALLKSHDWPGNIRELRNVCERVAATVPSPFVSREVVRRAMFPQGEARRPGAAREESPPQNARNGKAKGQVKEILKTLIECDGNMAAAAAKLGVDRSTVWRRMKRTGLL